MNYFKWFCFAPLSFLINILCYVLSLPLAALSVIMGVNVLPGFLSYFHTHDATLDGGQDVLGWPKVRGIKLMFQRAKWICRNPGYGFDAYVFGIPEGKRTVVKQIGRPDLPGKFLCKSYITAPNGKKYFSYRTHKLWFGWRDFPSNGRHILKASIRNITKDVG